MSNINITQYTNNQFEPKLIEKGHFKLSVNQTTGLSANEDVHFDTAVTNQGITFDSVNHRWTLKANKTYRLVFGVYSIYGATTGFCEYSWYDRTNSAELGTRGAVVNAAYTASNEAGQTDAVAVITPSSDMIVEARIEVVSGMSSIVAGSSYALVEEIQANKTPNTYPFLINAQQYDLTVTGTNWTTQHAYGIYYKTTDGKHKLNFNIRGTGSFGTLTSYTATITGVTFKTGLTQGITGWRVHSASSTVSSYANGGASTLTWYGTNQNSTEFYFAGDIELNAKPDFT